ncbi:hypothetical protein MMC22_003693 [Lobaria immixta]|nr:hypothetical protein [Lobaria immixta]
MVINQVVQLVNLAGGNISPREAILRMAQARFNYQAAVGDYLERLEDGSSSSLSLSNRSERDGDPGKVERWGEKDRRVSDDTDKESEFSLADHPDQSKLTITICRPDKRPNKVHRYHGKVDFRQTDRIRALNRWRSQIFRQNIGGSWPFRQNFHELEKDWLLQEHINFEQKQLA